MSHSIASSDGTPPARGKLLAGAVLFALVLSVYGQVGGHDFINFDDNRYVYENPPVLAGLSRGSVSWAFTTLHAGFWQPVTWLSFMADVELFGPSAGWHHRMNALYHLLNTELLFFLLYGMTRGFWLSAFVAALFGVHPLHVESVAWVTERKDVLSTLFLMVTIGAYRWYARRPGAGRYLAVAGSFALGLMSKPMLVTLPVVLLLLDRWPMERHSTAGLSRLALEKVPLFALSLAFSIVTVLAQDAGGGVDSIDQASLPLRFSNAAVSYVAYLGKAAWPASLSVFYPHPASLRASIPWWNVAGSAILLAGISFFALRERARRPYLAVGWLWYLVTLFPVIGLLQSGAQSMADRFAYVPMIGIYIAAAWGISDAFPEHRLRGRALCAIGAAAVLALAAVAWHQAARWKDSVTLFTHSIKVTKDNWLAWNNLGDAYDSLGRPAEAIGCFREAVRIKPDVPRAWYNLGVAYSETGQYRLAIPSYAESLRLKPGQADAWNNLGDAYLRLGEHQQAVRCFLESLRIAPDFAPARHNLDLAHSMPGGKE